MTESGRFIKFEMDLSTDKEKLIELYLWNDKTESVQVCKSAKGTGASWGYLVLKILQDLNGVHN